jgi:transcriptional regulator with XRE-family HTH domain
VARKAKEDSKSVKTIQNRIGPQLKRLRLYFGKSAKEFAETIDIDVTRLSKYESGTSANPTAEFFIKIKQRFGVSPDYFFYNMSPKIYLAISKEIKLSTFRFIWLPDERKKFLREEIRKDHNKVIIMMANQGFADLYDSEKEVDFFGLD